MSEVFNEHKEFTTLQAQFALRGHTLTRTNASDGSKSYFVSRWGMARHLPNLEARQRFLEQVGGDHGL
jgi:hypothetical protein